MNKITRTGKALLINNVVIVECYFEGFKSCCMNINNVAFEEF